VEKGEEEGEEEIEDDEDVKMLYIHRKDVKF